MYCKDPLKDLNPKQFEAVASEGTHLLVKAGPGTGKTRVLTARILYLINRGVEPHQILAVTFTNKAALEIRNRLETAGLEKLPQLGTFHSWAFRIISCKEGRTPFVIDEQEQRFLFKEAVKESQIKTEPKGLCERLLLLKQQTERDFDGENKDLKHLWICYHNLLKKHQLMDYEDLIINATRHLKEDPNLLPKHVLVDEFQDVSPIQFQLVRVLAAKAFITAIGDPYQAIYGFRGADPQFIHRFATEFDPVKSVTLSDAYRCPQKVLDAAASLFDGMTPLRSKEKKEGEILYKGFETSEKEASWIAVQIDKMIGGISFESMNRHSSGDFDEMGLSDICILYRTKAQAVTLTKALIRHGIPFHTPVNHSKAEANAISMLHHLVGFFYGNVKRYHLARLGIQEENAVKLASLLDFVQQGKCLDMEFLKAFVEVLDLNLPEEELERLRGVVSMLKEGVPPTLAFKEEQDSLDFDVEAVSLMTLHGSKGLEFPVVFLTGVEEDILPWKGSNVEEERRLFYVGLTRSAQKVFITACRKRRFYGRWMTTGPSAFIKAIEPYVSRDTTKPPKRRRPLKKKQKSLF